MNDYLQTNPQIIFPALVFLMSLSILFFRKSSLLIDVIFVITIIIAGALRYSIATNMFPKNHLKYFLNTNKKLMIFGQICGYPHSRLKGIDTEIRVDSVSFNQKTFHATGKALLKIRDVDYQPRYGDRLQIYSRLQQPSGERNPGEFDYRKFLAADGIHALIYLTRENDLKAVKRISGRSIKGIFCQVKTMLDHQINRLYKNHHRALIKGLLIGERGEIPRHVREAFARSGVIHALAISGLHVGYILIILYAISALFRIPYRIKFLPVLIGILLFNLLVGFKPPIARASLMAVLYLIGRRMQKPIDIFNIISVTALIILLVNPLELFRASFQLSFAAICSIVFIYRKLKILFEKSQFFSKLIQTKIGEYCGALFLVSLAAQLGTLPIVVYYFNRIPIISLVTNLVVIPLIGIVLAYGFTSIFFAFIYFPIGELFAVTNSLCIKILLNIINTASEFQFSSFDVFSVGLVSILLYYFCLWIILNLHQPAFRKIAIFAILIAANFILWKSILWQPKWLTVTFFDVGQGDAAFIEFPDGKNMLIDAGPKVSDFDVGKYVLVPYFKRFGIHQINTIILSHADNDHIGGMPAILRHIKADHLYDAGLYHQTRICSTYQFLIDSLKLNYHQVGDCFRMKEFQTAGCFLLHPTDDFLNNYTKDINDNSLVLKIVYGDTEFLFTGDIEKQAEEYLTRYGRLLEADVLKIAHHGSKTSSTEKFLKHVNPAYAVISVGRNNRFNFPDSTILYRLRKNQITVLRTDLNGAIIFRTDGNSLTRIR